MNLITQGEIATRVGLSRRSVLRWLARLEIEPLRIVAGLNMYAPGSADLIKAAQTDAHIDRANLVRASVARRFAPVAPAAPAKRGRIISVAEAKRRAKRTRGVAL